MGKVKNTPTIEMVAASIYFLTYEISKQMKLFDDVTQYQKLFVFFK